MSKDLRIVVTGGGTGGHFFPAMAIRDALKEKGVTVKYIGSIFGVEATKFSKNSSSELLLNIRGIQRQLNINSIMKNLLFLYRFLKSYYQSRKLLDEFKPHLVVGTGGYSSGLPLLAAIHKGIKTVIQEQNSYPGITTRHLASRVDAICIAYHETKVHLKKKIQFLLEILFERAFK